MFRKGDYKVIPALSGGVLPKGRWMSTLDELKATFVENPDYAVPNSRIDLWEGLLITLSVLEKLNCKVLEIFLSGSFITSKDSPDDLDVSFLVDGSRIVSPNTFSKIMQAIAKCHATYKVQGHVVFWNPVESKSNRTKEQVEYLLNRGFWDDFWQRNVPKAERDPFQRDHSFPKRGYVAVNINDYR